MAVAVPQRRSLRSRPCWSAKTSLVRGGSASKSTKESYKPALPKLRACGTIPQPRRGGLIWMVLTTIPAQGPETGGSRHWQCSPKRELSHPDSYDSGLPWPRPLDARYCSTSTRKEMAAADQVVAPQATWRAERGNTVSRTGRGLHTPAGADQMLSRRDSDGLARPCAAGRQSSKTIRRWFPQHLPAATEYGAGRGGCRLDDAPLAELAGWKNTETVLLQDCVGVPRTRSPAVSGLDVAMDDGRSLTIVDPSSRRGEGPRQVGSG